MYRKITICSIVLILFIKFVDLSMCLNAFTDYLLLEKKYATLTVKAYKSDLQAFKAYIISNNFSNINYSNYSEIRSWIVYLVEKGISNRSINRKVSSLNTYFKFLLKIGTIKQNPLAKHKSLKISKKVQIPFSEAEINTVIDKIEFKHTFKDIRNKLMIELFYSTGIRRIELVQLQLSNINLDSNQIKVLGKRNKERMVPLLNSVKKTVESYLIVRDGLAVIKDGNHFFLTNKGEKIYETLVYRVINEYFSLASTKVKKSPHILRHSFATHLLNEGADINAVKELLGHTSLAATQIYTHNSIAELKKVHLKAHPRSLNQK